MPLSWNEIKSRALVFSREWEGVTSEKSEATTFWNEFFHIFGISRRRVASFEKRVKKIDGHDGYIDLLWKGVLLIEHKSRGKDLDRAYQQATDYFPGLKERELPRYIIVSDFVSFRLYDLEEDAQHEIELPDLYKYVRLFGFIAGYQTHAIHEQDPVNIKAAERMGRLHDQLKDVGYVGHHLELYLVRLLFCLFADDTGIFQRQLFQEYLEQRTHEDGSDLGSHLSTIFHVLATPEENRLKNLDEQLNALPYVNGKLFEETLPPASFDADMRQTLLECCGLDWSRISPAIFGSLFQSIMDREARRNLGAHYTSEKNILKLIKPLFLDALWEEFEKIKTKKNMLAKFHQKLRTLHFLDPACGCGNFLVIAYRELRLLELEVLQALHISRKEQGQQRFNVLHDLILLDVDQFHGIEIEEFPAQIAQVALWLMDHQMNQKVSEAFGDYFVRIPLKTTANIVCDNALRLDWNDVIPAKQLSYILGNPPFVGAKFMNTDQRADVAQVFVGIKSSGLLDYVSAWYVKAAHMINNTAIRCAFVSTNSISQGEQVGVLWGWMLAQDMHIFFAHRTFQWSSEARGTAAVHCVIIGFAHEEISPKSLFEYEDIKGSPQHITAKNINPYLVDAPNFILQNRRVPISSIPAMCSGNKPIDDGNYLFTPDEKELFIKKEPQAGRFFRRWLGGKEFINNIERYYLWLGDCSPTELSKMPECLKLVDAVRKFRQASKSKPTQKLAHTPTMFHTECIPVDTYLAMPQVSSERRQYIPIAFLQPGPLCGDKLRVVKKATLFHFGVMTSTMHMAWTRTVTGRLKSDYMYSVGIVYNNFPWPENPSDKQKQAIESAAQAVLDARDQFPDASLADLYDPLTMPPVLLKAHQKLDKAVDAAYGKRHFSTEAARVAFLFELYQKYTDELLAAAKPQKTRQRKKKLHKKE